MENMFCFQCEQTAKGTGCTISGVCGKTAPTAREQDVLTCEMISLAKTSLDKGCVMADMVDRIVDGLFTTITNVNFDAGKIETLASQMREQWESCGGEVAIEPEELFHGDENLISLRSTLLFGLRGMAAYAHHARVLGKRDPEVDEWFIKGMASLAEEHTVDEWLARFQLKTTAGKEGGGKHGGKEHFFKKAC